MHLIGDRGVWYSGGMVILFLLATLIAFLIHPVVGLVYVAILAGSNYK